LKVGGQLQQQEIEVYRCTPSTTPRWARKKPNGQTLMVPYSAGCGIW